MIKKFNLGILIISIVLFSILVFGMLIFVRWYSDYEYFLENQAFQHMDVMNDNINNRFVSFLKEPQESHKVFSHVILSELVDDSFELIRDEEKMGRYLEAMKDNHEQIGCVRYIDRTNQFIEYGFADDGSIRLTLQDDSTNMSLVQYETPYVSGEISGVKPTKNFLYSPYYLPFAIGRKELWSELYISEITGDAAVSSLYPFYDGDQLLGVSTLDISLDGMNDFLVNEAFRYNSTILLFSDRNELVAHSYKNLDTIITDEKSTGGRLKKFSEYSEPVLKAIGDLVIAKEVSKLDDYRLTIEDKQYLVKFNVLEDDIGLRWYSVILKDEDSIVSEIRGRWLNNVYLIVIVSIAILLVTTIIIGRITGYLSELRKFAGLLIKGKYKNIPELRDINIRELSEVRNAFNHLLEDIVNHIDQLESSEEDYRLIFETSYEGLWHYDVQEDSIQISDKWFESLGYSKEQVSGGKRFLLSIIEEEDLVGSVFLRNNHSPVLKSTISEEFRIVGNDGAIFWILSKGRVTKRDSLGYPLDMVGGFVEITERKQSEGRLADTLALIEKLYEASVDFREMMSFRALLNLTLKRLKDFIHYSGAVLELYDGNESEIAAISGVLSNGSLNKTYKIDFFGCYEDRNVDEVVDGTDMSELLFFQEEAYDESYKHYHRIPLVRGRDVYGFLTILQKKEGEGTDYKDKALELYIEQISAVIYSAKLFEEIRQAKVIADKASRAKTEFLANMSHEIRTPMNAIIGYSDMIGDEPLSDEQHRCLDNLKIASESLLDILNDILDLSKIEEGKMVLEKIPFNMNKIIGRVASVVGIKGVDKSVEFKLHVHQSIDHYYIGDPLRIQQILINLLGNALKFTSKGYVTLDVYINDISGKVICTFEISDTGIGIERDQLNHLFEKFTQADSSTTREYGGSGLGLSIVNELVEMMDGSIAVESEVDKGSKFTVSLPLHKGDKIEEQLLEREEINEKVCKLYKENKVLVVEDNTYNMDIICSILEKMGLVVEKAENGQEAVEKCKNIRYELVFMDFQMPVMDGIQATHKIREVFNKNQLPIVGLSAHSLGKGAKSFSENGFNDYMVKPIDVLHLKEVIAKYLTNKNSLMERSILNDSYDEEDVFRTLSLIDYEVVGRRFLFNWSLYEKILKEFVHAYNDAVYDYRQLIGSQNYIEAGILAHNVKGVAGNLGLTTIFEGMKIIEENCKNNVEVKEEILMEIELTFFKLEKWIEDKLNETDEMELIEDANMLDEKLRTILTLAKSRDFALSEEVDKVIGPLMHAGYSEEVDGLVVAVNKFDYHEAEKIIQLLIERV